MHDLEPIQKALEAAVGPDRIPGIAAAVATRDGVIFEGVVGQKSAGSPAPMTFDSVFRIASMTKAITGAAAMQLVEQGRLALDQPAKQVLPLLGQVRVLSGFGSSGPVMRPPRTDITLRHLLTHTAGFAYDIWNENIARYTKENDIPAMRTARLAALNVPLVRDPGERWEYGVNIEMVGRMVEAASGLDLETYLQKNILMPLGMRDTSYIARDSWESRLTGVHAAKPTARSS
jgi:methyl acetate hydrolase